ncbi:MAG: S1/P1 nuclease, partial [Sphingomonadaceae bacterium]
MKQLALIAALTGAFLSSNAMAWGNDGHRAVGAIADQLIQGSNAQKQVAALLQPGESLEKIANWADCVKGTYCGPQSEEMVSYVAANPKHSEYHYTDVPFQLPHYHDHGVGTADEDIVQTLKQTIAVLQGKGDAASNPHQFTRRQALLILTHLAGDIHQPLHVGAAFVGKNGGYVLPQTAGQIDAVEMFDARGGNNLLLDDVKLSALSAQLIPAGEAKPAVAPATPPRAPQTTRPFHSYWDSTVVDY